MIIILINLFYSEGSHGLDLSFVTHIFLINALLDNSLEQQVVSRAYRMGATRSVIVEQIYTNSTIEEHLYNMKNDANHIAYSERKISSSSSSNSSSSNSSNKKRKNSSAMKLSTKVSPAINNKYESSSSSSSSSSSNNINNNNTDNMADSNNNSNMSMSSHNIVSSNNTNNNEESSHFITSKQHRLVAAIKLLEIGLSYQYNNKC